MTRFLKVLTLFLLGNFLRDINCGTNAEYNFTVVQQYLENLPKDGISFFKQFSQTLQDGDTECQDQIEALLAKPYEAIRMFDAWSKIPSGLLWRATLDYGAYDECLDIDFVEGNTRVMGKHCAFAIIIPYGKNIATESMKLSICIPNKCSLENLPVNAKYCTVKTDAKEWDVGDILVLTLLTLVLVTMILSTLYDVYLYCNDLKPAHPLYLAFSVYSNGKKLFHVAGTKGSGEQILVFHGLKFVGMCWIIAGHNGVIYEMLPLNNFKQGKNFLQSGYSGYLQTAHLAVDTFFFISGFLLAYLYFKSEALQPVAHQIKLIPFSILHRYLRLTPALLIIYLFNVYTLPHIVDGPLANAAMGASKNDCRNNWWAVFLYVQNYNNRYNLCMTNLWYVSADMQMFVFAPLILIPLAVQYAKKQFKAVMIEMGILCILAAVLPIMTKLFFRDYDADFAEYDTHSRIVDYVMGIALGIFIRHGDFNPKRLSIGVNVLIWSIALVGMLSTVVMNQTAYLSDDYIHKTWLLSLMRPLWCLGLWYVIWACYSGRGGVINWFLSSGAMQVGSRLTYSIYLVHGLVLSYWAYDQREQLHYNGFELFYEFSGALIVSLILSTILSLSFESPMITIEKSIFGRTRRAPPKLPPPTLAQK